MVVPRITKEELKQRLDTGDLPTIVDVRLKYPYEHSSAKLPGALRMTADSLDLSRIPRERDVILYDSDPDELVSVRAAAHLLRRGYRAWALKGGIGDWMTAKLPTETKPAPQLAPPAPGALKG
jgi:rhodanese-related sulfurtransferase